MDKTSLDALHAAGFNDAAFQSCLTRAVDDYSAWRLTNLDVPINPFSTTDSGTRQPDLEFSSQVMSACRQAIGSRCILDNQSLQSPVLNSDYQTLYASMQQLGPPIVFQTVTPALRDWDGAVQLAGSIGAGSVELWPTFGGFTTLPATELQGWATLLRQAASSPPAPAASP